jgi:hypothetical protein
MVSRQHILAIFSLVWLLNACATQTNQSSQAVSNTLDCPTQSAPLPITAAPSKEAESFYNRFDFYIRNIVADAKAIKFQTYNYDFVFCRDNNSWTVKPGTLPAEFQPPKSGGDFFKQLETYKTIDSNGKTYRYRVIIDPKPFPLVQQKPEAQKVVFELIAPGSDRPQRKTLYTLADLKQRPVGESESLGVPRITTALNRDNHLFFAVSSEQGEGASGIATIVRYDPQKNETLIFQPKQIERQQITDLVITGKSANLTLWMGTKVSGEGNSNLPGMGLVAYRPNLPDLSLGRVKSSDVNNSPLVGAIPSKLQLENNRLWVGTGNGICQLKWQAADDPWEAVDDPKNWSCQRFALFTKLPTEGVPLYSSLASKNPATTLTPAASGQTVEVLWFSPLDLQTRKGRYEVRYSEGFTVTLDEQGAQVLPPDLAGIRVQNQPTKLSFSWLGYEWHWNGERFVRGFDEVALNLVGTGPSGISSDKIEPNGVRDSNTIRGEFDLLNLSRKSTSVRYYSGWVDEENVNLALTVVPHELPEKRQPNPLTAVHTMLNLPQSQ